MVQVFAFHLMPYGKMPEDFNERYDSSWVTYSNANYDPEYGNQLYHNYLDQLEFCEQMGFDGIGVNEHHQTPYGLMPSPNVMAATLARRTQKVKIAILGNAISLRDHPQRVAEEVAILDVITKGRIISGFVRGIGAEYHSFQLDPTKSKERFFEAHDLIIQAWTQDGPTSYYGQHYQFPYVNSWPRPYQKPHPPIWCPSQGSKDTIRFAAQNRYPYLQTFSSIPSVKSSLDYYRQCAEEFGYTAPPEQLGWSTFIYCAETDAQAHEEAEEHAMFFFNKLFVMPKEFFFPPGYIPPQAQQKTLQSKAGLGQPGFFTYQELTEKGYMIVGSPKSVREQLREYHKQLGFGLLNINIHFGDMPHDRAMKNIELLGKEVIPSLKTITVH
ncbi:LLM class flavin-dependent oxidoreductase [Brevibacillus fulvus]|uniref:Alkanesulfonate monooxygenase SsuD/methylene tetrahydromethanopterin reductase-like flavin-dependent oxidoreductase (Luciferase family) n=1 Tax=Brevibacillus fulvus TaxID=1125967 RepID=A0A938XZ75_9BACL|nr:LLM class flavin-dependent oxidoreductase [Brevibacillus fulvus]MBM7589116.1 alkanesulfonate monooxygenase SsuD/methylene tetrahydromethanopterin reductase-like flavin-dependent oxidoreductase (luciferase family) [Brevibacillus fulvus]